MKYLCVNVNLIKFCRNLITLFAVLLDKILNRSSIIIYTCNSVNIVVIWLLLTINIEFIISTCCLTLLWLAISKCLEYRNSTLLSLIQTNSIVNVNLCCSLCICNSCKSFSFSSITLTIKSIT